MEFNDFIKQAARVKPDERQLRMLRETPFYLFVHFSPNTYTDLEWGDGTEDPAIFNPTELDCEQWARAAISAGAKGIILTAKHHDGFCLWQSAYTEHCMKNSPYKNGEGDVVRECADACRKYGLKFGFYLSPWDRNSKYYGTDEYNDYYCNQLTELLTNYGEIFHVWFDGACGEGPNGKKQVYDFDRYLALIEKYQPQATYFNDAGIIRWCGNESGTAAHAQWAVVPSELCFHNKNIQTGAGPFAGTLEGIYNSDGDLGALSNILYSKGLVFSPAETDMSIRPGWFWHEQQQPHSLERLFDTYLGTVGGNTTFNLNVPPMKNGRFDSRDVKRLAELGELIRKSFEKDISADGKIEEAALSDTQSVFTLTLPEKRHISFIEIAERISEGQRVEGFKLFFDDCGIIKQLAQGTTIGSRRILKVDRDTDIIKLKIISARDRADIEWIKLY
ncbi:MAG: alpha-L-fucosidase [Clostridia bacterium]|nr:alpha-L-fucosidase [Clostridia bacterium]